MLHCGQNWKFEKFKLDRLDLLSLGLIQITLIRPMIDRAYVSTNWKFWTGFINL